MVARVAAAMARGVVAEEVGGVAVGDLDWEVEAVGWAWSRRVVEVKMESLSGVESGVERGEGMALD